MAFNGGVSSFTEGPDPDIQKPNAPFSVFD
jgi:hypothetical protein